MTWKLIRAYALALLVLPGTVLVFVPWAASILAAGTPFDGDVPGWQDANAWAGTLLFALGFALAGWTNRLFLFRGEGTPAPWDPPRKFVVHGPYRHVRNPMMLAVYLMLAGEALAFAAPAIGAWLAAFLAINSSASSPSKSIKSDRLAGTLSDSKSTVNRPLRKCFLFKAIINSRGRYWGRPRCSFGSSTIALLSLNQYPSFCISVLTRLNHSPRSPI